MIAKQKSINYFIHSFILFKIHEIYHRNLKKIEILIFMENSEAKTCPTLALLKKIKQ